MTTIMIRKTHEGAYRGFICMGHAEYSRRASKPDILCAAISALVMNTLNSLEELTGEEFDCTMTEETGFIRCDFKREISEGSALLMDSMVLGLNNLSHDYGAKYLQVKFEEV